MQTCQATMEVDLHVRLRGCLMYYRLTRIICVTSVFTSTVSVIACISDIIISCAILVIIIAIMMMFASVITFSRFVSLYLLRLCCYVYD